MLSLEKIGDAGSLVPRWSATGISSISLDKSAWVKGHLLWACHVPVGQLLLSLSLEHPQAPLELDIRLGSSKLLYQGEDKNILLAAVGVAQPGPAMEVSKKGQLGVSTYRSKPLFGKRAYNFYQLQWRCPHCFLGGWKAQHKGPLSPGVTGWTYVSSWWKSGSSSSDLSGAFSQLSKPGCVKSPSGHPAKNILHLKVILKKKRSVALE